MDKTEYSSELFLSGYNCAQSVFATFAEDYGLSRDLALKIPCGLGGGVRCAEICGAVTGAALIIGLKNGYTDSNDLAAKDNCAEEMKEFTKRFKEYNGALTCRDILGINISDDAGRKRAQDLNLLKTVCVDMVTSAVEILEDMGY